MLHGREPEISAIDRLLAEVRAGSSGALVVRGEPGIGKTALLEYAAEHGGDLQIMRSVGVRSESDLAFAGLHLLIRPVLDRIAALPEPQRQALEGAFGLADARGADRLLVGLGVLSLLAEAAEDGPVLCLVDDAHWLDRSSLDALTFAARRLGAESVALIMATRGDHMPGLPEIRLRGLSAAAAAAVLEDAALTTPALRYRVLAEAQGNPLALIELPAALSGDASPSRPGGLPLTSRLRAAFAGQVDHLPEATQTLLLVAAMTDRLGEVLAAGERFGFGAEALLPAEKAGLVAVDDRAVTFRHPLIREAVYQRAPVGLRLAVHAALADVLSGDHNADRRAWHRAAAAVGPNEETAAELERTALRAADRRGYAAAAAAYERAAALTDDAGARGRRLALAAEAATEAGELDRAGALAGEAAEHLTDPLLKARLLHVRSTADFWRGRYGEAHRLVLSAADLVREIAPAQAVRMLTQAFHTGWYVGEPELKDVARRLSRIPIPTGDPMGAVARVQAGAFARLVDGTAAGLPPLGEAVADARALLTSDHPREQVLLAGAPLVIGADVHTLEITTRLAEECRARGRIGILPTVLFFLAEAELFHEGRHHDALTTVSSALRIAEDTGQHQWVIQLKSVLAYLAALAGDEEGCRRLCDEAVGGAVVPMQGALWVDWARGVLDLGCGRVEAALTRLEALAQGPGWYHISAMRCVPDLVEAAVRHGEPARARPAFARYERWALLSEQPLPQALADRCRALLGAEDEVEDRYLAALSHRGQPFEHARTSLLYGEWLRRSRRKAAAGGHLREALETFERLGARPWADRARAELEATGTRAPKLRARGILADLTPQELQIVRLAAQGLSNKDIAAQLILSPRTVGYHLYKAYPKLGVASRAELAALDLSDPA
ncbi:helix-turn-helix transcriptional regulator [Microbispora sp. NBRC 16548]|uniref:AAA family ATPase n=1 Tax=Microbispora sp. NBRC 16548 TaxID=3030994 RepID=UPI0024A0AFEB|nr:helix-turn-helix transcriptional regulator [Microbispora sp. NBRC 16548]GLX04746.1 transcriptional regulator [Microbispora sp. NBRC 16548]